MNKNSIIQISIVGIAVIALSLLYFFHSATNTNFYPKCIFYEITGLYCPGCGSQRAVSALLHGQFLLAMHDNILMICCIPLLVYSAGIFVWNACHSQKKRQRFFYSTLFVKSLLIVVIVFAILRNIHAGPFNLLAPVL